MFLTKDDHKSYLITRIRKLRLARLEAERKVSAYQRDIERYAIELSKLASA